MIVVFRVKVRFNTSVFAATDGISNATRARCSALHPASCCILALVHGIPGPVLNGLILLPFAGIGLNGLAWNEAEGFDQAV